MQLFLLFMLVVASWSDAAHVLVVFPMPGKSHSILGDGVVRHLLEAGHEVTYITPFPKNNTNPKLHEIDVSSNLKHFPHDVINITAILNKEMNPLYNLNIISLFFSLTTNTLDNENVQKLMLDKNQKFDAAVLQWVYSNSNIGFAAVFDCPYIYFSTTEVHSVVLGLIDEASNPAYVPTFISNNVPPFTFLQRVKELALQTGLWVAARILAYVDAKAYEEGFGPVLTQLGRPLPPFNDVKYNASLMLGNSHVSLGGAHRLPQSYKDVGGFHIETNTKPLLADLKKLLDASKDGVIYFSMGSNLRGKDWPPVLKEKLLKMFGTLKQTVLWKFEEDLVNVPRNVRILKWAPQQSILAHPNCRLFITHGGQLSTVETIHFGVPIIGIPVYGDQFSNIDRAVKKGFAIRVDLTYDIAEDLNNAINEVFNNPSYTSTAKTLSMIYHDRPTTPGKDLAHWVHHVVKTNGAPHLRSPALNVPFYQKYYLDLLVVIYAIVWAVKKLFRKLCCGKKVDVRKKNN